MRPVDVKFTMSGRLLVSSDGPTGEILEVSYNPHGLSLSSTGCATATATAAESGVEVCGSCAADQSTGTGTGTGC